MSESLESRETKLVNVNLVSLNTLFERVNNKNELIFVRISNIHKDYITCPIEKSKISDATEIEKYQKRLSHQFFIDFFFSLRELEPDGAKAKLGNSFNFSTLFSGICICSFKDVLKQIEEEHVFLSTKLSFFLSLVEPDTDRKTHITTAEDIEKYILKR